MYNLVRKIHLYTGLGILTFVAMYFFTGYVLIHGDWFPGHADKTVRTEAVPAGSLPADPEGRSRAIKERFGLRGKPSPPKQQKDGRWTFDYFRPADRYQAVLSAAGDTVKITRTRGGFRELMVGLHRLHGYSGGAIYLLWAFCYDLAALSLLVFAGTGIWIWWNLKRRRLPGWVFLATSFGFAAATVVYLTNAR